MGGEHDMQVQEVILWVEAITSSMVQEFSFLMLTFGFFRSEYDSCVYFKALDNSVHIYFLLYVDDLFIVTKDLPELKKLKSELSKEFDRDLGETKNILGLQIKRGKKGRKL